MSTLSKAQIAEIGDFIRNSVLMEMADTITARMGGNPNINKMWKVIDSNEFPELTEFYNERVNQVCDELKSK